jgi:hypothetical protein
MLGFRPLSVMQKTNKNEANKAFVLQKLEAVRAALRSEPAGPQVDQALAQCDRLQLAITQFHAEGLRFAAFTLLRMTLSPGALVGEPVRGAAQTLKTALEAAGFPH